MRLHAPRVFAASSLMASALAAGAGCGGGASPEPIPPQLSAIEAQIFTPNCTFSSCHGGGAPQEGMSLVSPAHASIVGVPSTEVPGMMRVAPDNPDASYLLHKITSDAPMDGERMPPGQPLPPHKIEAIRLWISAGAQDN